MARILLGGGVPFTHMQLLSLPVFLSGLRGRLLNSQAIGLPCPSLACLLARGLGFCLSLSLSLSAHTEMTMPKDPHVRSCAKIRPQRRE